MIIREAKIVYKNVVKIDETSLSDDESAVRYIQKFIDFHDDFDHEVEHFMVIALDRKMKPKGIKIISKGTVSATLVHPREAFRFAIIESASAVIVTHNHPSGDPAPSKADIQVTRQLRDAAKVIGIELVDHIVIGDKDSDPNNKGYYSFNNAGLI